MKKTILLAAMACLLTSNVFAQKIKGSDTVLPLTQTEAENYMNKNKSAKITVCAIGLNILPSIPVNERIGIKTIKIINCPKMAEFIIFDELL